MKRQNILIFFSLIHVLVSQTIITVPSALTVPRNGCTSINITAPGDSNGLILTLQVGATLADFNVSRNTITFTQGNKPESITFCSLSNSTLTSFPIIMSLSGRNSQMYYLSNGGSTMINILNAGQVTNGQASIMFQSGSVTSTSATYGVMTNGQGNIYSVLWETNSRRQPLDFVSVKQRAQSQVTLPVTSNWIYLTNQDPTISYVQTTGNVSNITVDNLTPSINYSLCVYFQSNIGAYSLPNCTTFVTKDNIMARAQFNFTHQLQPTQLNRLLCYFVSMTNAQISNIATLDGQSCNPQGTLPTNYKYNYHGTTIPAANSTIVYVMQSSNDINNQIIGTYESMFEYISRNFTQGANNTAINNGVNFINAGLQLSQASFSDMLNRQDPFNNVISFRKLDLSNGIMTVQNLMSSKPGSAYFVLASNSSGSDATNMPTVEQVLNCRNARNQTAYNCTRVVFSSPTQSINLNIYGLQPNSQYKLYYVTANQYPKYPITDGKVVQATSASQISSPKSQFDLRMVYYIMMLIVAAMF